MFVSDRFCVLFVAYGSTRFSFFLIYFVLALCFPLRGNLQKKPSIFKDTIQIKVDHPPFHPIFDKFIFDKVLIMLTSLPSLGFLTKIMKS